MNVQAHSLLQSFLKIIAGKTGFLLQTKQHIFSQFFVSLAALSSIRQGLHPQEFL